MPRLEQQPQRSVKPMVGVDEGSRLVMPGIPSRYPRITPEPQGPESLELSRILSRVLRSLEELETMRPYFGNVHTPYLALLGRSAEAKEVSLDYQSLPPNRTVSMNTRFFIRGRGQPKPYLLEDE